MGERTTRVLIIDAHQAVRSAMARLVASLPGCSVASTAAAVSAPGMSAAAEQADVALVDVEGSSDECPAIRMLRRLAPGLRLLAMGTLFPDGNAAIRAGADAYFLKHDGAEALSSVLRPPDPSARS